MISKHLKVAVRHLRKNKLFTFIKMTGLTAGITACLLVWLYLRNELSYDACHKKADRIVRTVMTFRQGGQIMEVNVCGNKVASSFRRDFPEVESAVRIMEMQQVVKYGQQMFEEQHVYFADSTLLDIFTFPLTKGDPAMVLNAPDLAVLTEEMAVKYFGTGGIEEAIGKVLTIGAKEFTVSGVMQKAAATSQLKPDFIVPYTSLNRAKPENESWWNANEVTYLLLQRPELRETMQAKIPGYMRSHSQEHGATGDDYLTYRLEPLRDVHLRSSVGGNFEPNGDIRYIYILAAIGLLILLIGVSTYVNLTTAAGLERAKEASIQKVLGAGRNRLFFQHLIEAGLLTAASLTAGYALVAPLLPVFNRLFDRALTALPLLQPSELLLALIFWAVVTLLTGVYPAFIVSGFQPVTVLKGNWSTSRAGGSLWLRKSLIVLQFGISVFLFICTMVLQNQLHFIQNKKIGFDKDHVIALPTDQQVVEKLPAIKSEFMQNPEVRSISLAYETPLHIKGRYGIEASPSGTDFKPVTALPADENFLPAMNIELAAGVNFTAADRENMQRYYNGDTTVVHSILINESQAKSFGWTPEAAVNRFVNFENRGPSQIKGVVKDFHFSSLHEPIGNLVIFPDTWGNTILVKLSGKDIPGTMRFLEEKWQTIVPHRPFSYHFLDEEFARMYGAEMQTARLVTAFSALAIFLACLGLFGLASFTIVQRTKEIGIRKVLGATTAGIVGLLSRDFLSLVIVSLVIASPLAWYLMDKWFLDFAYRIDIPWWVFALAGAVAVAVAFLTVSFQSVKAAMANPVESLRNE